MGSGDAIVWTIWLAPNNQIYKDSNMLLDSMVEARLT